MSSQHRVFDLLVAAQAVSELSARAIAEKSGLSHGTVSNYLAGKIPRTITDQTLDGLSKGFGIPLPRLRAAYLADRGLAPAESPEPTKDEDEVVQAILSDTRLLPEAKEHLVRQYGLLLRVQAARVPDEVETAEAIEDAARVVRGINSAKSSARKRTTTKRRS